MTEEKTHFGYKKVPKTEKQALVKGVFDTVTEQYDLMNDLMSFGIHRLWKDYVVRYGQIKPNQTILDLAAGTCDISSLIHKHLKGQCTLVASDINNKMLSKGRARLLNRGLYENIYFAQANAEHLPFADNMFDRVFMGFGLRNVTDKLCALKSIYQKLKPGGQCLVLEFSKCQDPFLNKLYDLYSAHMLPKLGAMIAKDKNPYQYLNESIRVHENQEALQQLFLNAGFDSCNYQNLSFGIVAIHRGLKA